MSDEVTEKIHQIIAEQALIGEEDVKPESTPQELGLDSLSMVEIVFAVEETFNISVPFNANDPSASEFDISTVGAIAAAVKNLIAKQKV